MVQITFQEFLVCFILRLSYLSIPFICLSASLAIILLSLFHFQRFFSKMNGLLMSVLFLASTAFAVPIASEEAAELNSEYTHQSKRKINIPSQKSSILEEFCWKKHCFGLFCKAPLAEALMGKKAVKQVILLYLFRRSRRLRIWISSNGQTRW